MLWNHSLVMYLAFKDDDFIALARISQISITFFHCFRLCFLLAETTCFVSWDEPMTIENSMTSIWTIVIGYGTLHLLGIASVIYRVSPSSSQSKSLKNWIRNFFWGFFNFKITQLEKINNKRGIFGNYTWISTKPIRTGPFYPLICMHCLPIWGVYTNKYTYTEYT